MSHDVTCFRLLQELAAAGENQDAAQLRRLMTQDCRESEKNHIKQNNVFQYTTDLQSFQASSLDLAVPPSVLALVDELEVPGCGEFRLEAHRICIALTLLLRQEIASTKPLPAHQLFAQRRAKRAARMCPRSLLQVKRASRILRCCIYHREHSMRI